MTTTSVTSMLTAPTLMVLIIVLAKKDTLEMDAHVQVSTELFRCSIFFCFNLPLIHHLCFQTSTSASMAAMFVT